MKILTEIRKELRLTYTKAYNNKQMELFVFLNIKNVAQKATGNIFLSFLIYLYHIKPINKN